MGLVAIFLAQVRHSGVFDSCFFQRRGSKIFTTLAFKIIFGIAVKPLIPSIVEEFRAKIVTEILSLSKKLFFTTLSFAKKNQAFKKWLVK